MILRITALGALLMVGSVLADDDASRAKLMGSWQLADSGKDAAVWTIQEKADILHIINSVGGRIMAEFDCDSFGHECAIKDGGRPAKVSLWYLGPKLVEMETETKGGVVWRRTFVVTGEGDTMDIEVAQIAPSTKTETLHFKRVAAPAAAH
jgi:hypothetical protein